MSQYHRLVSLDAHQFLSPFDLGSTLQACSQFGGGVPAALALLLSHQPGTSAADLGQHPYTGHWSKNRILAVGDYARDDDLPGYEGPPLSHLYRLCSDDQITLADLEAPSDSLALTAQQKPFDNIAPHLQGAFEHAAAIRLGTYFSTPIIPGNIDAQPSNYCHLPPEIVADDEALARIFRFFGLDSQPHAARQALQNGRPNGQTWPWDRPPHGPLTYLQGADTPGQLRVFANLDRGEFIDPARFGETPTTLGIMQAAETPTGSYSAAAAIFAMTLHPETRGGGDLRFSDFAELGLWRGDRLWLTSESTSDLPTTAEVKASFEDITSIVLPTER